MTKVIYYIIYITGIILICIFDFVHADRNIILLIFFIQCFSIYAQYRQTTRNFEGVVYIQSKSPGRIKDLLLIILLAPIFNLLPFYFIAHKNTWDWLALIGLTTFTYAVYFFIFRGRSTAYMIVDGRQLIINEFFIKRYDLTQLRRIDFDGFYEKYYFTFTNGKELVLKRAQFEDADENNIIAALVNAAGGDVLLAGSLKPRNISLQNTAMQEAKTAV